MHGHHMCKHSRAYYLWHTQGIKLGDFQATVSAFINAGLFFVVSQAKPMEVLSPKRPHPNIFCAYVFLSMLGQFALHTGFLIFVYTGAVRLMPEVRGIALCRSQRAWEPDSSCKWRLTRLSSLATPVRPGHAWLNNAAQQLPDCCLRYNRRMVRACGSSLASCYR